MYEAKKAELAEIEADLHRIGDDELRRRLGEFLEGYKAAGITLAKDSYVYRARAISGNFSKSRPIHFNELHMPPPEFATRQRLNLAGAPVFYSGVAWDGLPFELRAKKGDHLITSSWRIKKEALVLAIGYSKNVFEALGSERVRPEWASGEGFAAGKDDPNSEKDFLGEMLTRPADGKSDEVYRLTSIMAGILLRSVEGKERVLCGLVYPTVAMYGNGDNVAFAPWFAREGLEFAGAREYLVEEFDDEGVKNQCVDRVTSVNDEGYLEWAGIAGFNPAPDIKYRATARAGKTDDGFYLRLADNRPGYWEFATEPEGHVVYKMA